MGISRRLPGNVIPRGFKAGETWVFLAHREAVPDPGNGKKPGVFSIWRPSRIEKVVPEDVTDDEVEALEKRGIEPVIVRPAVQELDFGEEEAQ